jgi:hypothetical protein
MPRISEEYDKVQPPAGLLATAKNPEPITINTPPVTGYGTFPYPDSIGRLNYYDYFERLFLGQHFNAFNVKIDSELYGREYGRLRYVVANFAGLISRIVSDLLFGEPIVIKVPDGDQEFIEVLWDENKLDTQCYESALSNSYMGDGVFKIRAGLRTPSDTVSTCIIEDITPKIYFPRVNGFNVRENPNETTLAWTFKSDDTTYLRTEKHIPDKQIIENHVYEMNGNELVKEVDVGTYFNLQPQVYTGITESLIYHVPNWKTGDRYFGISDYSDLDSLFYAVNNRLTKIDNILDKHGDPILTVPQGILDEHGRVNKKALGVIEVHEGENNKPEYIVWDASLESAFKEIEKLVEMIYLMGEISPDILGLGQGVSDSGRALKFKLIRTIAKVSRKRNYYDRVIKDMLYTAQVFCKKWGLQVDGRTLKGEPVYPEIEWADGLPVDSIGQMDIETKAIDAGISSKKAAIMRVYGVDEKSAEAMLKESDAEKPKIELPKFGNSNPFEDNDEKKE